MALSNQCFFNIKDNQIVSVTEKTQVESNASATQLLSVGQRVMNRQKKIMKQAKNSGSKLTIKSLLCVICQDNPVDTVCVCVQDCSSSQFLLMNT